MPATEISLVRLIPESRLPAMEAALLQTFRSTAIDKINMLSGGLSGSAVYKMTMHGRAFVLKLDIPSGHSTPALVQASEQGVAPRLYFREPSSGITISDFIESQPIRKAFSPEKLVSELAIQQKYPWGDPDRVLSHNDINPGNLFPE